MRKRQSVYDDMSPFEKIVAEYITSLNFWWTFQQPVYVADDKERPRIFVPDFYLPELGIYVEAVGNSKLDNYDRRMKIYTSNDVPIVFVYYENKDWKSFLVQEIFRIHQSRWEKIRALSY